MARCCHRAAECQRRAMKGAEMAFLGMCSLRSSCRACGDQCFLQSSFEVALCTYWWLVLCRRPCDGTQCRLPAGSLPCQPTLGCWCGCAQCRSSRHAHCHHREAQAESSALEHACPATPSRIAESYRLQRLQQRGRLTRTSMLQPGVNRCAYSSADTGDKPTLK